MARLLTDLLVALIPIGVFLDLASYHLATHHRAITPMQWGSVALVNLTVVACIAFLLAQRGASRRKSFVFSDLIRNPSPWFGWVAVIAHVAAKSVYTNMAPRWDAGTYFGEILRASEQMDLSLASLAAQFRLAGHPSHAYGMYLAIGQFLFPASHYALNIQNTILAALGIYCFWLFIRKLLPQLAPIQHLIAALTFAFNPLFFGNSLYTNADFPVTVLLFVALACIAYNRQLLFSFAGLCLVFSKEPGTFLFALLLFFYFVFYVVPRIASLKYVLFDLDRLIAFPSTSPKELVRRPFAALRGIGTLVLALLPIAIFFSYHRSVPKVTWTSAASTWNDAGFLCFGLNSTMIRDVLYTAIVMNFGWIPATVVVAYFVKRQIWEPNTIHPLGMDERALVRVVASLFAAYLTLQCLYINYLNPRYNLPLIPLGLTLFTVVLYLWVGCSRALTITLAGFVCLSSIQTWYSFDPISRRLWSNFEIGNRSLVNVGGGVQGLADGMVYNAQFTAIERLYRAANRWALAKNPQTVILVGTTHYWLLYYNLGGLRVDEKTFDYTTKREGSLGINLIGIDGMNHSSPFNPAVYLALPWIEDVSSSLQKLQTMYSITGVHRINYGDYYIDAYTLQI